ncbi:MAG: aminotransferase class III-fold pyridoxal phosphate-dependent enzyme [Acidobacteria bacterium]|nr:aminotransferase class III-fold pyridoxal phosphate-dependent enzyme [Acidobacteriota bacterium]
MRAIASTWQPGGTLHGRRGARCTLGPVVVPPTWTGSNPAAETRGTGRGIRRSADSPLRQPSSRRFLSGPWPSSPCLDHVLRSGQKYSHFSGHCRARAVTGGYAPLGAVVFERSWGEELRRTGLNHGLTFGGHPLGCSAARQTIRILKEERLVDRARSLGRYLLGRLEEIRDAHPEALSDVRGHGLLLAIQFRSGRRLPAARRVEKVCTGALGEGIRLLPGSDGTSIVLCPPFTVSASRVACLLDVLERQVRAA